MGGMYYSEQIDMGYFYYDPHLEMRLLSRYLFVCKGMLLKEAQVEHIYVGLNKNKTGITVCRMI